MMLQAVFYIYPDYASNIYQVKAARKNLEQYNKILKSVADLGAYMLTVQKDLRGKYRVTFKFK